MIGDEVWQRPRSRYRPGCAIGWPGFTPGHVVPTGRSWPIGVEMSVRVLRDIKQGKGCGHCVRAIVAADGSGTDSCRLRGAARRYRPRLGFLGPPVVTYNGRAGSRSQHQARSRSAEREHELGCGPQFQLECATFTPNMNPDMSQAKLGQSSSIPRISQAGLDCRSRSNGGKNGGEIVLAEMTERLLTTKNSLIGGYLRRHRSS